MLDLRFKNLAIGIAVGAGIGAGGAYAYLKRLQPATPQQPPTSLLPGGGKPTDEASVFRYHPAFKYGMPQTDVLRIYEGYVTSFDMRTRNPKWVLEYISSETLKGDGTRDQSQFYEDPGIEPRFRCKLDDFKESGYDRGHMAPAMNHKASQKAMNDTFSLSNISPQVGQGFNRDYWARFEKFVKDTAKSADGVFVLTGPLWLPSPDGIRGNGKWEMKHPMIGKAPQLVSVPTHYFKVVLAENSSGKHGRHQAAVGAFVMPNSPIDPATPVTAFAVPLEALESVAGAKFFPGFINDRRREALDGAALAYQAEGKQQLKMLDRVSLTQDQAVILPHLQTPAPAGLIANSSSGSRKAAQPAAAVAQQVAQPSQLGVNAAQHKTVGGDGALHLCDHVACKLPEGGWWETAGGSRSGIQRQNSRGRLRSVQEAAVVAEAADEDLQE